VWALLGFHEREGIYWPGEQVLSLFVVPTSIYNVTIFFVVL
jgi:hypothetical protein